MTTKFTALARWAPPVAALLLLSLWAWDRLELFRPYEDVTLPDGSVSPQPNALTTVDHPWHGARFSLLLDALRDGHPLRWVGSHQGGFPVEFYPLGAGLIDLVVWAATLGQLPTPLIHTYAVGVTFLLPIAGFLALASLSKVSPWVGVLAAAAHLCVRGWWWSGGSMELIEWGLVTNVAAATFLFLALPLIVRLMRSWSGPAAAGASCLLGLAILTNPRSAIAIVALVLAVGASTLWHRDAFPAGRRLAVPTAFALGLAAPLLVPLVRYRDLYYFAQFTGYGSIGDWCRSSIQAVSGPVAICTLVGLVLGLRPNAPRAAQVVALTLVVYSLLTISLIQFSWPGTLVDQLETTRLMPFQRLLMIAVAAIGFGLLLERLPAQASVHDGALAAATAAVVVLYVAAPPDFIPEGDRGLVRIATYADPSMVELERSVKLADSQAGPDTAVLVLGSYVSWHAQLWAPTWSDRRFFYDDWLWYWQQEHVGDYDVVSEHAYRSDASALDPAYLATHGIGAVVVGREARPAANTADWLSPLSRGAFYDVYAVVEPTSLVTVDGQRAPLVDDAGNRIKVSTDGLAGPMVVRTNWFPRWQATADGDKIKILHRPDGYMEVDVPPGTQSVTLTYAVTRLDWLARLLAIVAAAGVVGLVASRLRSTARSAPR